MHDKTHNLPATADTEAGAGAEAAVSRFALIAAAIVFSAFVLFLLGVAVARDTLNSSLGPFSLGVWLLLAMHVLPVVLGIVHMARAQAAAIELRS